MLMAETAISAGRSAGAMRSRSMRTEVSTSARLCRGSATWCRILIDQAIHVPSKTGTRQTWTAGERRKNRFRRDKHPLAQRGQLANRHSVACHDETLALVQRTHDSPAFVAEFPLRDPSAHRSKIVAPALQE